MDWRHFFFFENAPEGNVLSLTHRHEQVHLSMLVVEASGASSGRNATSSKAPSRQRATLAHIPYREKEKIPRTGGQFAPRRSSRALNRQGGIAERPARMATIQKVPAPHALAILSTSTTASQNRGATGHQSACVAFRFRASFQHLEAWKKLRPSSTAPAPRP